MEAGWLLDLAKMLAYSSRLLRKIPAEPSIEIEGCYSQIR
jgi:hypothetical protein